MRVRESLDRGHFIEGFVLGRCWRLWLKPWAWPYYRHEYGTRCAGVGPFGWMLFDRQEGANVAG